ncbi:MAG: PL29 family lyase N-terminal domain-containing protein [Bacteroidales bacterium]|nr:PL29 family lyase N-terminal domain-containing protein [Bacteroidales bacterium]
MRRPFAKILSLITLSGLLVSACQEKFDPTYLEDQIKGLDSRLSKLESVVGGVNSQISQLQAIVSSLQSHAYVVSVDQQGDVSVITFSDGKTVTVNSSTASQVPTIGATEINGVYYWTVDGKLLCDADGNPLRVTGRDGKDGENGKDGQDGKDGVDGKDGENGKDGVNGQDGKDGENGKDGKDGQNGGTPKLKIENGHWYVSYDGGATWDLLGVAYEGGSSQDGITPRLKIVDGYWYVSYDEGSSWTKLGKAQGEDGKDGQDGRDGVDGKDGINGIDGTNGRDGVDGKDGENGRDGVDGTNGKDGSTPRIGVKQENGVYYWTVNGSFLLDEYGQKIPASGSSNQGSGESIFAGVKVENGVVTITLKDGTSFIIPMKPAAGLRIEAIKMHFTASEKKTIHLELNNIVNLTVTEKPEGWRAKINGCGIDIQAPSSADADRDGFVAVLATSGDQTFIGKIWVTLDRPLFDMVVTPNGVMTLTELDYDFNNPGFLAGFMKAEAFDPVALCEVAKQYVPGEEGVYTSWSSISTGTKDYVMNIADASFEPVPGERYVAYCLPGAYSRAIGSTPNPYDIEVRYFTYVKDTFVLDGVTSDKAVVSISMTGTDSFYGGLIRIKDSADKKKIASMFLDDALVPIRGVGDGMYGYMMDSYEGNLNNFAALDDGDGGRNTHTIVPGGRYVIGLVPKDAHKAASEYTLSDVILKEVNLLTPTAVATELVTAHVGHSTTTSASVSFDITSAVSKLYYILVTKSEFEKSGLSAYDYALKNGIAWDRAILKANGAISGIGDGITGLKPGEQCIGIAVAFTNRDTYYMTQIETAASQVVLSSETLSLNGFELTPINANSTAVKFSYSCSANVQTIRYMILRDAEFESTYGGSEDRVFDVLTAGSRWNYDEITPGHEWEIYVYPEDVNYTVYATGMDTDEHFTRLVKLSYKPV